MGGTKFLLERGDKPEKGEGVDVEMGGLPLFLLLYSSVQSYLHFRIFNLELAMQDFHPRFNPSLVLKLGIICTFLIHSGSLQKILTAFLKQLYKSFPILSLPFMPHVGPE